MCHLHVFTCQSGQSLAESSERVALLAGGFCGPYVVGSLVDRGGYVQCMQVLGGLFLILAVAIARAFPPSLSCSVLLTLVWLQMIVWCIAVPKRSHLYTQMIRTMFFYGIHFKVNLPRGSASMCILLKLSVSGRTRNYL